MKEWEDEIQKVRDEQKVQQDEWKDMLASGQHPLEAEGQ
jgi:hypothetical protein